MVERDHHAAVPVAPVPDQLARLEAVGPVALALLLSLDLDHVRIRFSAQTTPAVPARVTRALTASAALRSTK